MEINNTEKQFSDKMVYSYCSLLTYLLMQKKTGADRKKKLGQSKRFTTNHPLTQGKCNEKLLYTFFTVEQVHFDCDDFYFNSISCEVEKKKVDASRQGRHGKL